MVFALICHVNLIDCQRKILVQGVSHGGDIFLSAPFLMSGIFSHYHFLMVEKWRNKILKPKNEAIELFNPYWTPCMYYYWFDKESRWKFTACPKSIVGKSGSKKDNFLILFFSCYFRPHWMVCLEFTLITFVNNAWWLKICTFSKTVCP